MTATPHQTVDARAAALEALFERAGYARLNPPMLLPSELVLDVTGEEMRKRILLTTDGNGVEWCLRPDLTIPVSRHHLAGGAAKPAAYSYMGPVFRTRDGVPEEFLQAGVESFGRIDAAAADAETLALALETARLFGVAAPVIRMGDVGLFAAFVQALDIAPAWKRRLLKDFARPGNLDADLAVLSAPPANGGSDHRGLLAAMEGANPKAARALVSDLLSIGGISTVGGRSVGEIADRFIEQAALGAGATLPQASLDLVRRFLAIAGDPDEASADVRALAEGAGLDLGAAIDAFDQRTGFIAARGVDPASIAFSTAFGRGVDYYTGFVFEFTAGADAAGPLVAGGRYDNLLKTMGAAEAIPAVGFAAWIGRLANAGGAA